MFIYCFVGRISHMTTYAKKHINVIFSFCGNPIHFAHFQLIVSRFYCSGSFLSAIRWSEFRETVFLQFVFLFCFFLARSLLTNIVVVFHFLHRYRNPFARIDYAATSVCVRVSKCISEYITFRLFRSEKWISILKLWNVTTTLGYIWLLILTNNCTLSFVVFFLDTVHFFFQSRNSWIMINRSMVFTYFPVICQTKTAFELLIIFHMDSVVVCSWF